MMTEQQAFLDDVFAMCERTSDERRREAIAEHERVIAFAETELKDAPDYAVDAIASHILYHRQAAERLRALGPKA